MKILNRAKSKYKDYYPIGQWLELGDKCFIIEDKVGFAIEDTMGWFDDGMMDGNIQLQDFIYEVEKDTRALNFEGMLDSQGNKIFASLSKDGKGGDIVDFEHIRYLEDDKPSYIDSSFFVEDIDNKFDRVFYDEMGCNFRNKELKVIGVQE